MEKFGLMRPGNYEMDFILSNVAQYFFHAQFKKVFNK